MHKDAKTHWHASEAIRCHGCTAKHAKEDAAVEAGKTRRGAFFTARPDDGLLHAMSDPILTYEDDDTRFVTGASGLVYPPTAAAPGD